MTRCHVQSMVIAHFESTGELRHEVVMAFPIWVMICRVDVARATSGWAASLLLEVP